MSTTDPVGSLRADSPTPVLVFWGTSYLHVAPSVQKALEHANEDATKKFDAGESEPTFIDASGTRLTPVGTQGSFTSLHPAGGLKVDVEGMARAVFQVHESALQRLATSSGKDELRSIAEAMLDDGSDFQELVARLAQRPEPTDPRHFGGGTDKAKPREMATTAVGRPAPNAEDFATQTGYAGHTGSRAHNLCHYLHLC